MTTAYIVDDLQAVEPDSLMDTDGITVEVEDGLDSMGFNRVSVQGVSAAKVIAQLLGAFDLRSPGPVSSHKIRWWFPRL